MDYRGSKSDFKLKAVKEQRVDGSYFSSGTIPRLRCTLMGGVSCYQISNPSKQIFIKKLKLLTKMPSLNRSFYTQTNNLIHYILILILINKFLLIKLILQNLHNY